MYDAKYVSFLLPNDEREHFVICDAGQGHIDALRQMTFQLNPDAEIKYTVLGAGFVSVGVYSDGFGIHAYGKSTSLQFVDLPHLARKEDSALINDAHASGGLRFFIVEGGWADCVYLASPTYSEEMLNTAIKYARIKAKGFVALETDASGETVFKSFSVDYHVGTDTQVVRSQVRQALNMNF